MRLRPRGLRALAALVTFFVIVAGCTPPPLLFEIFEQLRGKSTNQVDGATIGLAHNVGGPTAVSAITILSSDKG